MGNVESRLRKLEDRFGVNREPESLEEMIEKFNQGEYGPATVMSLVVGMLHAKDLNEYADSLRKQFPDPLIDCFLDGLILAFQGSSKGEGLRDRQPGESKADYLKYQINECYLVVG